MSGDTPWTPDWRTPPADHLVEVLCDLDISPGELAQRCGMTRCDMTALLMGARITEANAPLLSHGIGATPQFWLRLQEQADRPPNSTAGGNPLGRDEGAHSPKTPLQN